MKNIFKKIKIKIQLLNEVLKFNRTIKILPKNKSICIFDIDNTLAHTRTYRWDQVVENPTLLRNLDPINEMIQIVKNASENEKIFFLSARLFTMRSDTIEWLKKQGLEAHEENVFLVPSPRYKLIFLANISGRFPNKIKYYDDLSFDKKNGSVGLFNEIIDSVMKMPIEYFGQNFILQAYKNNG